MNSLALAEENAELHTELERLNRKVMRLREVLRGYEQWEAKLLMDNEAWGDGVALPTLTQELFDQLLELQRRRNEALMGASE